MSSLSISSNTENSIATSNPPVPLTSPVSPNALETPAAQDWNAIRKNKMIEIILMISRPTDHLHPDIMIPPLISIDLNITKTIWSRSHSGGANKEEGIGYNVEETGYDEFSDYGHICNKCFHQGILQHIPKQRGFEMKQAALSILLTIV